MQNASQDQIKEENLECSFSNIEYFNAPIKPTVFEEKGVLKISSKNINYNGQKYN